MKKILATLSGFAAVAVLAVVPLASAVVPANTVVVTAGNSDGWTFSSENTAGGTGSYVTGPATPPAGSGSAQLGLTASNQGFILAKQGFAGTKLSDLTELKYSTYVQTGNNTIAPALSFNFDPNVTDGLDNWYGRITYEPYQNGTVTDGIWQEWDALKSGDANWWFSWGATATADYGIANPCPQSDPCTTPEIVGLFANAGVRTDAAAAVIFKAGSGWSTFLGNVDKFVIGTASSTTTYDFEKYYPTNGQIISPTVGENVSGTLNLSATYDDGDNINDDGVQWAVRAGTCAAGTGTVFGNVDGKSTPYNWNGKDFTATIDVSTTTPGSYCFIFNPSDDPGENNVRETVTFNIVEPGPVIVTPTTKDDCKKGGFANFTDADGNPFKNQGLCVAYVASAGRVVANFNQIQF